MEVRAKVALATMPKFRNLQEDLEDCRLAKFHPRKMVEDHDCHWRSMLPGRRLRIPTALIYGEKITF